MAGLILSLLLSHMHVAHYHRVPVRHHQVRVVQHKAKAPTRVVQRQAPPRNNNDGLVKQTLTVTKG
jgi:hypothetical protein